MRKAIANHPFRLGPVVVDPRRHLVMASNGRSRKISPTPLSLLKLLVNADGEVVSNDDLQKMLGHSEDIGCTALYRAICDLRKALGDNGSGRQIVMTVHGIGYRLGELASSVDTDHVTKIDVIDVQRKLEAAEGGHVQGAERCQSPRLDIRRLRVSPRHAYLFRVDPAFQWQIETKLWELKKTGKIRGWRIIISIQEKGCTELHCGNPAAIAWLLYARQNGLKTTLASFRKNFDDVVILQDRKYGGGETWHPYILPSVACTRGLASVRDPDHFGMEVRQSVTPKGVPIYFDNLDFYSGVDISPTLEEAAMAYDQCRI